MYWVRCLIEMGRERASNLWFNRPSWWFRWILQSENHCSHQKHHRLSVSVCRDILTAFQLIFLRLLLHPFSTQQSENIFLREILQWLPMSIKLRFVFLTLAYKSLRDLATPYSSLLLSCSHNTGLLFAAWTYRAGFYHRALGKGCSSTESILVIWVSVPMFPPHSGLHINVI